MTALLNSDALRWVVVAVACADVALLFAGTIARWDTFTPRLRRVVPWVIATYVVIAYGAGEVASASTPAPTGIRVILTLLVLLGLLIALSYRITEDN